MKNDTNSLTEKLDSGKAKKKKRLKKKDVFWVQGIGKLLYTFKDSLISKFLKDNGYRRYTINGTVQIVQIVDGIAHLKSPMDVFNDLLEYIRLWKDNSLTDHWFLQGEDKLIKRKGLLGSLMVLELKRYRDTKNVIRLFYKNYVVKITKSNISTESYKEFRTVSGFIFHDQIIQREFDPKAKTKSDFKKFLRLVTIDKRKHYLSICTGIGYLLSNYKNPSLAKAIILTDILSQAENDAYGRSGKGIIIKAISEIIKVVEYNGKVTDLTNDKFVFQNVDVLTSLIVLQDVSKSFVFESLFSTLTDTMVIERKHKPKISIPFNESPKIALTTNYTIPQDSDSYKDRKHLLLLNNFFNAGNKPEKYFKTLLFHWEDDEWARFDSFMARCCQLFLKKGLSSYHNEALEMQKLINQTSADFVETMEGDYSLLNEYYSLKKLAASLELGVEESSAKSRIAGKWVDIYAAFKGYQVERRTSGGATKFCFRP